VARRRYSHLRERAYGEAALRELLSAPPDRAVDPDYAPLAVRRVAAERTPLATLAALLLLGREVEPERARAALAPLDLDRLAEAGVLATGDRGVRATLRVLPYEGLLLAFDPPTGGPRGGHGAGALGRMLASLTVRRRAHGARPRQRGRRPGPPARSPRPARRALGHQLTRA
jgi:hypothetical protein